MQTDRELRRFTGHHGKIVGLEWVPGGKRFITISEDANAVVWDLDEPDRDLGAFEVHEYVLVTLAVSPDGSRAATADQGGNVFVWDVKTCREIRRLPQLVLEKRHPGTKFQQVGTGKITDTAGPRYYHISKLQFFPDGRNLAIIFRNAPAIFVYDSDTGEEAARYHEEVEGHSMTALAVSPNGDRILFSPWNGPIRLWHLPADRIIANFVGHVQVENGSGNAGKPGGVKALAFTADGKHALSGGEDGTVRLWNLPE